MTRRWRAGRGAIVTVTAWVAICAGPSAIGAQSLAEIARLEAERRARITSPGRVYTNADLVPDFTRPPQPPPPSDSAALPLSSRAETSPAAGAPSTAGRAADADRGQATPGDHLEPQPADDKDEAFWRGRAQGIRARLAAQNAQVADLRSRIGAFPPGSTDGEKALVEKALQRAVTDLKFLDDEWLRFEQLARERRVPDHWIR